MFGAGYVKGNQIEVFTIEWGCTMCEGRVELKSTN
jgi:hypothetical protein